MSRYEKGKPITGNIKITSDLISIISDPHIAYGPHSNVFSIIDCSPSRPVIIVQNGNFAEFIGTHQFYEYLGLLDQGMQPSSQLSNTLVKPGQVLKVNLIDTGRVVVIKMFSDWTVNSMTGDFACEIRLGEIRENGKATPIQRWSLNW